MQVVLSRKIAEIIKSSELLLLSKSDAQVQVLSLDLVPIKKFSLFILKNEDFIDVLMVTAYEKATCL